MEYLAMEHCLGKPAPALESGHRRLRGIALDGFRCLAPGPDRTLRGTGTPPGNATRQGRRRLTTVVSTRHHDADRRPRSPPG
jgi:hypothetical protein